MCIGITKNKTDTTYTLMVHMVHGISSASADTYHFNLCRFVLFFFISSGNNKIG